MPERFTHDTTEFILIEVNKYVVVGRIYFPRQFLCFVSWVSYPRYDRVSLGTFVKTTIIVFNDPDGADAPTCTT